MDRRQVLFAMTLMPLAAAGPIMRLARAAGGAADQGVIDTARILTGRSDLPAAIIARAQHFQAELDQTFASRLPALVEAVARSAVRDREAVIAGLSAADAATAVQLISPLYLGYTGSPSTTDAIDNAKFVTFLDALMYEPTADNVPRPSYAIGGPNYWTAPPHGVAVPPMADNILEWGDKGPRAATRYATPDPRYVAMCQGHGKTLAEAAAWLAGNHGGKDGEQGR